VIGVAAVAAVAAVTVGAAIGIPALHAASPFAAPVQTGTPGSPVRGDYPWSGGSGGYRGHGGSDGSASGTAATGTPASSAQSAGIVIVETDVDYGEAEAAGTGMVLTPDGEVLTNNHVVAGSTAIKVEVVSTGTVYTADVVGTDATDDVAVLRLDGAHGLATADVDASGAAQVGDAVTGVGDAQGQGALLAATGTVTGLDEGITTEAEQFAASESLTGLIETDAAIQSGDSGGPLYDADGRIVGMDTAASSGGTPDSYAIPISRALGIAHEIVSGTGGDGIEQGTPAFLGVQVAAQPGVDGAAIAGVIADGPAARAGLAAGDVITAIGGTRVASADELGAAIAAHAVGSRVSVGWVDVTGQAHAATVTLTAGPAA
jgi:S1-C subfamily serine protease